MIDADGWLTWAIKRPGPAAKSGYRWGESTSAAAGVVCHSAEGYASTMLDMLADLSLRKSWTASNMKNGDFLQHYPVDVIVWTNGSYDANRLFRGVESEGVAGEWLTAAQVANLVRFARELGERNRWPAYQRGEQLWEHREMTRFGAAPTACPSGRIPWEQITAALAEEGDMPSMEQLREELKRHRGWKLVKGSGAGVYVVRDGRKVGIANPAAFWGSGYEWPDVETIADDVLAQIPDA